MGEPEINKIQNIYDERWLTFIQNNPQANFFHHPAWLSLMQDCYGYHPFVISLSDQNSEILAGLPIMEVNNFLGKERWVSLPFTDYCSPVYNDKHSLDGLADGIGRLIKNEKKQGIELRCEIPLDVPLFRTEQYLLHTLKLDDNFERVSSRFDRIHRQNVRQAEKNQVRVEWGRNLIDIQKFYDLQVETRRRHGVPSQPWRFFKSFYTHVLEKGYGSVLIAYQGDRCIAGLILLHWQKSIICKYAASREESMKLRPNNLLFWTAIRWGCENGYQLFDMGRTDLDNPGLRRFKQGWGADELPLTYFKYS